MRTILFLSVALVFINQSCAQNWGRGIKGEGASVEKMLKLDNFSGIKLTMAGNVFLTQGNQQSVRIIGQQNIIDLIETTVYDGVWKIKPSENIRNYDKLDIYITIPHLSYAKISGSGNIVSEGAFKNCNDLDLGISGSGGLKLDINADDVDVSISGSGDIELSGQTNTLELHISGSGDIDAVDMVCNDADVHISGSGECRINVDKNLDVHVSGSGDVYYKGNPNVHSKVSGSGDLHSL